MGVLTLITAEEGVISRGVISVGVMSRGGNIRTPSPEGCHFII